MRPRAFLFIWIIAIIFPAAWFSHRIFPVRQAFDFVFKPEWMHILAHAALYALLAGLCELAFPTSGPRPVIWLPALRLAGLVLLVGAIQEGIQVWTGSARPDWLTSGFDLGVDLAGSAIGFWILYRLRKKGWNFLKLSIVKG